MKILKFLKSFYLRKNKTPENSNNKKEPTHEGLPEESENIRSGNSISKIQINQEITNLIDSNDTRTSLPINSIYEATNPKFIKRKIFTKELETLYISTSTPGVKLSLKATLRISGVIQPTEEEIRNSLQQILPFFQKIDHDDTSPMANDLYLGMFDEIILRDSELSEEIPSCTLQLDKLIKKIRAKIRTLKKQKIDLKIYLETLKNAIYMYDMSNSLELSCDYQGTKCSIIRSDILIGKKSYELFKSLPSNFTTLGYELFPTFNKTDIKWLIQEYGEPKSHASPKILIRKIKSKLIQEYYEIKSNEKINKERDITAANLLQQDVVMFLGYHKSWFERVKGKTTTINNSINYLNQALDVTNGNFIVADLETTGLSCEIDEIIEIGAILCDKYGNIINSYQSLINSNIEISQEIEKLTGISNEKISQEGRPLSIALKEFKEFIGFSPLFFHNSDFDAGFLRCAADEVGIELNNSIYDTLTIARLTWKKFKSHSLSNLCTQLDIKPPKHRAIDDAEAALKVLMAAREQRVDALRSEVNSN